MTLLTERERKVGEILYKNGWSPCEITARIQDSRAEKEFYELNKEVHHYLAIVFKRKMYPAEKKR